MLRANGRGGSSAIILAAHFSLKKANCGDDFEKQRKAGIMVK